MKTNFLGPLLMAICLDTVTSLNFNAYAADGDELPFLKSDYLYEYLNESKIMMGGNVVSESKTEITYDDDNHIISMVSYMNGQKLMEMIDYTYSDRKRTHIANNYSHGEIMMSSKVTDTFADDIYRNMLVSERETEMAGNKSVTRYEWIYDDQGRIIGMKEFLDGQLQMEQKEYVWTPNSCEYIEERLLPFPSVTKVTKQFQDEHYVQNVLEIHASDRNGVKTEFRTECQYDDNGNLISLKSYLNGQLSSEWKDYNWGDKKSSHTVISYMNGNPTSTSEVVQYYK